MQLKKTTLHLEIQALKDHPDVPKDIWAGIDAIRTIGNCGAHIKTTANTIIDVTPEETDKLLWLIEFLIEQWYIRRHEQGKIYKS